MASIIVDGRIGVDGARVHPCNEVRGRPWILRVPLIWKIFWFQVCFGQKSYFVNRRSFSKHAVPLVSEWVSNNAGQGFGLRYGVPSNIEFFTYVSVCSLRARRISKEDLDTYCGEQVSTLSDEKKALAIQRAARWLFLGWTPELVQEHSIDQVRKWVEWGCSASLVQRCGIEFVTQHIVLGRWSSSDMAKHGVDRIKSLAEKSERWGSWVFCNYSVAELKDVDESGVDPQLFQEGLALKKKVRCSWVEFMDFKKAFVGNKLRGGAEQIELLPKQKILYEQYAKPWIEKVRKELCCVFYYLNTAQFDLNRYSEVSKWVSTCVEENIFTEWQKFLQEKGTKLQSVDETAFAARFHFQFSTFLADCAQKGR